MKKYLIGFLVGLFIGGAAMWVFRGTVETGLDTSKDAVGETMKKTGKGLQEAGETIAK